MQTNGITSIMVKGVRHSLLFGRASVEEMATRTADSLSTNRIKMFTDLIYSGLSNHAIANDAEFPEYSEVYTLVDEFQDEEDATEQHEKVWEVFQESRFGKEWIKELEENKKKIQVAMKTMKEKMTKKPKEK